MKSNAAPTTSFLKKLASRKNLFPNIVAGVATSFTVFVQTSVMVSSGTVNKLGQLVFNGTVTFKDSAVHLGIINELLKSFPPYNFAYTAEGLVRLENYHYLLELI